MLQSSCWFQQNSRHPRVDVVCVHGQKGTVYDRLPCAKNSGGLRSYRSEPRSHAPDTWGDMVLASGFTEGVAKSGLCWFWLEAEGHGSDDREDVYGDNCIRERCLFTPWVRVTIRVHCVARKRAIGQSTQRSQDGVLGKVLWIETTFSKNDKPCLTVSWLSVSRYLSMRNYQVCLAGRILTIGYAKSPRKRRHHQHAITCLSTGKNGLITMQRCGGECWVDSSLPTTISSAQPTVSIVVSGITTLHKTWTSSSRLPNQSM